MIVTINILLIFYFLHEHFLYGQFIWWENQTGKQTIDPPTIV